jgi:hypothetical protein
VLRGWQRRDLGVLGPQLDDVGREHERPALRREALDVRLALVAVEGSPVPVDLVDDPLHRGVRHEVDDVHQGVRLARADLLGHFLGEPVEVGDPVVEQGEDLNPAVRPRRGRRRPARSGRCL